MRTRRIGELEVSVLGLGCNQIGTTCDLAESREVVHAALDEGITFFDTADEYGDGRSEELLGEIVEHRRDDVVIGTKFGSMIDNDPNRAGASARWIEQAVEDSLRRLRTDRIDLYQQHFPDGTVPVEETLTALDRLVTAGKVREVGVCNVSSAQIDESASAAATSNTVAFRSLQTRYNLLRQEAEDELIPACERHGMAVIPFFPLASGLLTGKYRRGAAPVPGSRFAVSVPEKVAQKILSDPTFDMIEALEAVARGHDHSLLDLAVAWLVAQPVVSSVICGATRASQVSANAAAASWTIGGDVVEAARAAVAPP